MPKKKPSAKCRQIPFDEYQALSSVNSGILRNILVSPAHALYWLQNHKPETPSMFLGRGFHCHLLEPAKYREQWVSYNGTRKGGDWDAFRNVYPLRNIATVAEDAKIRAMVKAVKNHPLAGPLLKGRGKPEVTIEWVHPRTGVMIKCRLDWLTKQILLDVKTTKSVKPGLFASDFARLQYHVQLALYSDAAAAAGYGVLPVKVIAVEKDPPHEVAVFDIGEERVLGYGRELYEQALDTLLECRRTNHWPGMAEQEEIELNLPAWARPEPETGPIMFGEERIA